MTRGVQALGVGKEFGQGNPEAIGEPPKRANSGVQVATLDATNVVSVQPGREAELLLADAAALASCADGISESAVAGRELHAAQGRRKLRLRPPHSHVIA